MLPDDFIFEVDVTGCRYHCIRRNDSKFDVSSVRFINGPATIYQAKQVDEFIGMGWTIVSVNDDETEIDIQNLI